uniref:Ig-like domain-containing protein n=1 Tax=Erpetoichthys calabaricus TaxID=27687 RepID=A0A8C4SQ26_ERPCA
LKSNLHYLVFSIAYFFLFSIFLLVDSLDQPFRSLTALDGGTVTLVCSVVQFHPNDLFWFKHTSGEAPRYITSYMGYSQQETFYGEFEDSRFHIEKTNSTFNLKIEKLQPLDMATYYCGEKRFGHVFLGPGTVLCLTGKHLS